MRCFRSAQRIGWEWSGRVRKSLLHINDQFLETIEDGAYLGELGTGLYAQADALSAATVRFDNFRIEAP